MNRPPRTLLLFLFIAAAISVPSVFIGDEGNSLSLGRGAGVRGSDGGTIPQAAVRLSESHLEAVAQAETARETSPHPRRLSPGRGGITLASGGHISGDAPRAEARSWPQFRGPTADGHATANDLPLRWSEKKNVRWKTPTPGLGWSSPAVADDRIWLTTALDDGRSLHAICLDQETGAERHDVEVFRIAEPGKIHPKNSHATPTPILSGEYVFVHFGAHGTACLDRDGNVLWTRTIPYYHHHGPSASPVLAAGNLIIPCDGFTEPFYDEITRTGVDLPQFVIALDAATGQTIWKTPRDGNHAYCTPLVIEVNGATQVVSPGGKYVAAYDPETGREIWRCDYGDGYSVVPSPVYGNDLVYVCTGYDTPALLAIRPDGTGDVTATHVAWRAKQGVPLNPSPLLADDKLYLVSDGGVMSCLDAKNGKLLWKGRLGGNFSAAPILSGGHIYACSESGVTHVISTKSPRFDRVAGNKLDGHMLASPAVSGNALFLRTDGAVYRIENESD
ncbi:MAG: PQQ-like beta-propeller repeat protein [Planctomycetota bacterium]|nr:PQQ-binding-like beta-propeller repeat protein [Planctomycetaceae bacterium]MDQ3329897.1 PQQ-like beta-propeller repeat protein [Planctomycetota bacterium]